MTGHGPVRVTVTVECRCGATGDHVLSGAKAYPPAARELLLAAAEAFTDHLLQPQPQGKP